MLYLCTMRLLELEARTYIGKEYRDYLRAQEVDKEEGNEWKKDLYENRVPRVYPCRIMVNPKSVISAIESYSIEEMVTNPENPRFDSVDLCLEDGLQISLTCNMDEFMGKWSDFNKESEV